METLFRIELRNDFLRTHRAQDDHIVLGFRVVNGPVLGDSEIEGIGGGHLVQFAINRVNSMLLVEVKTFGLGDKFIFGLVPKLHLEGVLVTAVTHLRVDLVDIGRVETETEPAFVE